MSDLHVPDLQMFLSAQRPPYTQLTVRRTNVWLFRRGTEIHELISPEGHRHVMQSLSRHVDPELDLDDLPTLGERLQLPEGWQYNVRALDEDLEVSAHGDAHIVFDEYENNYQRYA
ncbi:hypothetical protein ABT213_23250 [Streptomyces sp. NPDC001674]|uniref:hypothetical protein n=1 Tax=Streptomyces sp. NPDC001674 TaxID=3154394 RepID=UPI00331A5F66